MQTLDRWVDGKTSPTDRQRKKREQGGEWAERRTEIERKRNQESEKISVPASSPKRTLRRKGFSLNLLANDPPNVNIHIKRESRQ